MASGGKNTCLSRCQALKKRRMPEKNVLLSELRNFRKLLLKTTMPEKHGRFFGALVPALCSFSKFSIFQPICERLKKIRLDSDSINCYHFCLKLYLSVKGMSPFIG